MHYIRIKMEIGRELSVVIVLLFSGRDNSQGQDDLEPTLTYIPS